MLPRLSFLRFCLNISVYASNSFAGLLNASLSLQDAFEGILPIPEPPSAPATLSPRQVIYFQTFSDTAGLPLSLLPLLEYDTRVTHVILGAVHLHEEPGKIMLNNEPFDSEIYDNIWKEVRILQDYGVKVMALLGGAAPGTYERLGGSDEKFNRYYNPLISLIRRYNLDGLDIDIEEPVPLSTPLRLLHRLHTDQPSLLLTMAPLSDALATNDTSLSGFAYHSLDAFATIQPPTQNKTHLISWFNVQSYGASSRTPTRYHSIIAAGFVPERIVLSVTTSAAGGANSFTPLKGLVRTIRELKGVYGDRSGGVAGWEYWDAGRDDGDMGMRVGGEPWRWVGRVGEMVFGGAEHRRGRGWNGDCWRRCFRGYS